MSIRGPKEKKERSLGEYLQLKAYRGATPKAALMRKPYKPGQHGPSKKHPKALSEFGLQLKEKQKFKLSYGIDERNLRTLFEDARRARGSTAEKILELLERRLDNVLFRAGIAESRSMGRQFLIHGHVMVNGRIVRSPGYLIKAGEVISVKEASKAKQSFKHLRDPQWKREIPSWIALDKEKLEAKVLSIPKDIEPPFEVKLLVEAFSK
ncbi:MAG: 30S ribosomal protein S4 [Candidatus Liptonbacteria bacterium]|nr:30S ribosomal protein S4 [Candidatus Liptonbacteria bacterium]